MDFMRIGPLAILAAAAAGFLLGALYYAALSRRWRPGTGVSRHELRGGGRQVLPFVVSFLAQLVMAAVLAWFLAHGVGGPAEPQNLGWFDGLRIGFLAWLGFTVTALAVDHSFRGDRRALTGVDGLHWLGVLLIQGVVLASVGGG